MAPKAKAPPPPPEDETTEEEKLEMAGEVMDSLIGSAFSDARNRELDGKRHSHEVSHVANMIQHSFDMHFYEHDIGENVKSREWTADPEPEPAASDSWSRGCVPIRAIDKKPSLMRFPKPGQPPPPLPVPERRSSVAGFGYSRRSSSSLNRPSSAMGRRVSSSSASASTSALPAGAMRPSTASALRSTGALDALNASNTPAAAAALNASASMPSLATTPGAQKQKMSQKAPKEDAEYTPQGVLICRGIPRPRPVPREVERIDWTKNNPRIGAILRTQQTLERERVEGLKKIDEIERSLGKDDKDGTKFMKEFYYGAHGDPVVLTIPDGDKAEPIKMAPRFVVPKPASRFGERPKSAKPKGRGAAPSSSSDKTEAATPSRAPSKSEAFAEFVQAEFDAVRSRSTFVQSNSKQPPVEDSIKLQSGVRLLTPLDLMKKADEEDGEGDESAQPDSAIPKAKKAVTKKATKKA